MAVITRLAGASLDSLLPGSGEQLPDGQLSNAALSAAHVVYLASDGLWKKALATDGTAATDRAGGIVARDYGQAGGITIFCGGISFKYAAAGTLTPGIPVFLSDTTAGLLEDGPCYSGQKAIGYVESDGGSIRFWPFRFDL